MMPGWDQGNVAFPLEVRKIGPEKELRTAFSDSK
jgi:hypothetical protein